MKGRLTIAFAVLLLTSSCGTEFGNGVHGKTGSGSTASADPAKDAFDAAGKSDISSNSDGSKTLGSSAEAQAELHLFAAEHSPLAEAGMGTFVSTAAQGSAFKLEESAGQVALSFSGDASSISLKSNLKVGPFAIDVKIQGTDLIKVQSFSRDGRSRTLAFTDGYKASWDLDSDGRISEIRVENADGSQKSSFRYIAANDSKPTARVLASEAYLFCEEPAAQTAAYRVLCRLQDSTGTPVDLDSTFKAATWSYTAAGSESPSLSAGSGSFQQTFTFPSKPSAVGSFKIQLTYNNNAVESVTAKLAMSLANWTAINGSSIPGTAIVAGSEQLGSVTLNLCRMHIDGKPISGKIMPNLKRTNESVCYSTSEGESVWSNEEDDGKQNYQSDVFVMLDAQAFADVLEWGLPTALAVQGPSICRVSESGTSVNLPAGRVGNKAEGEWTPGYLDGTSCKYDFFKERSSTSYEVLLWKNSALRQLSARSLDAH